MCKERHEIGRCSIHGDCRRRVNNIDNSETRRSQFYKCQNRHERRVSHCVVLFCFWSERFFALLKCSMVGLDCFIDSLIYFLERKKQKVLLQQQQLQRQQHRSLNRVIVRRQRLHRNRPYQRNQLPSQHLCTFQNVDIFSCLFLSTHFKCKTKSQCCFVPLDRRVMNTIAW